jgi:hypothetical protein
MRACMLISEKMTIKPVRPQPTVAMIVTAIHRLALAVLRRISSEAASPPSGKPKNMAGKDRNPAAAKTPPNPKLTVARIRRPLQDRQINPAC